MQKKNSKLFFDWSFQNRKGEKIICCNQVIDFFYFSSPYVSLPDRYSKTSSPSMLDMS